MEAVTSLSSLYNVIPKETGKISQNIQNKTFSCTCSCCKKKFECESCFVDHMQFGAMCVAVDSDGKEKMHSSWSNNIEATKHHTCGILSCSEPNCVYETKCNGCMKEHQTWVHHFASIDIFEKQTHSCGMIQCEHEDCEFQTQCAGCFQVHMEEGGDGTIEFHRTWAYHPMNAPVHTCGLCEEDSQL